MYKTDSIYQKPHKYLWMGKYKCKVILQCDIDFNNYDIGLLHEY